MLLHREKEGCLNKIRNICIENIQIFEFLPHSERAAETLVLFVEHNFMMILNSVRNIHFIEFILILEMNLVNK